MSARGPGGGRGGQSVRRPATHRAARERKDGLDGPDPEALRRVTDRAIRRLGMLETLILAGAALAALAGGALAAFLAASAFGWPFRPTWAATSLLFFVVPGAATWARSARAARAANVAQAAPGVRAARAGPTVPGVRAAPDVHAARASGTAPGVRKKKPALE